MAQGTFFALILLNKLIETQSPLAPPKHLTLEMATVYVRHETARRVDFNDVQLYKLGEQALRLYQKLQGELLNPINKNQFERKTPERLTQTRTTNVHKR